MRVMDESEWKAFIATGTRTGMLATVRADGRPHCVPIWFVFDAETLVFSSGAETVKTRNIESEPRVALTIDDPHFPYAFVMIEGMATIERMPVAALRDYTMRIAKRYVPADRAAAIGDNNAADSEVLIRITPGKVVAWARMSG